MTAKLTLFVVCSTAFGQMDTSTLRAKYGVPLARETFRSSVAKAGVCKFAQETFDKCYHLLPRGEGITSPCQGEVG